jgi:predicted transcriptional regulator of viral defense system
MPETFTSKDFVAATAFSGISSLYLRQMLTRWTKQGRLKRLQRGKYQKTKKANAERLVA